MLNATFPMVCMWWMKMEEGHIIIFTALVFRAAAAWTRY